MRVILTVSSLPRRSFLLSSSALVAASSAIGWPLKLATVKPAASERTVFERAFKTLLNFQSRCVRKALADHSPCVDFHNINYLPSEVMPCTVAIHCTRKVESRRVSTLTTPSSSPLSCAGAFTLRRVVRRTGWTRCVLSQEALSMTPPADVDLCSRPASARMGLRQRARHLAQLRVDDR